MVYAEKILRVVREDGLGLGPLMLRRKIIEGGRGSAKIREDAKEEALKNRHSTKRRKQWVVEGRR